MKWIYLCLTFLATTAAPAMVSPQQVPGLRCCYDARTLQNMPAGLIMSNLMDMSSHGLYCTNTAQAEYGGPVYNPGQFWRMPAFSFYRTNWLALWYSPFLCTTTNYTYFMVARLASRASSSVLFDSTEPYGVNSVMARLQSVSPADVMNAFARGSNNVSMQATSTDWLETFKILTVIRSGNLISFRINGNLVATNYTVIGADTNSSYFAAIGSLHNVNGMAPFMSGDVMAFSLFLNTLTPDQINGLEAYYSATFGITRSIPVPIRYPNNPVIPASITNNRILEPTVLYDSNAPPASVFKMWYSGNSDGISQINNGWCIYYATSPDGTNWSKVGIAMTNGWEPDVIKVNGIYYMSHTADLNLAIYVAFSTDGTNWVDSYPTAMIDTNNSAWGTLGPRESNIYYENGKFYIFYADEPVNAICLRIGRAVCTGAPTNRANWVPSSGPVLNTDLRAYNWANRGMESPCVRYYPFLPYPYLMTYIGYNTNDTVVHNTWRDGIAFAPSINGPWIDGRGNPWFSADTNGAWDDAITAEMTHLESNGNMFFYYSGARQGGTNQVGLVVVPDNIVRMMEY